MFFILTYVIISISIYFWREDKVPFEGAVYYDVYFYILIPGEEKIKIIIDMTL